MGYVVVSVSVPPIITKAEEVCNAHLLRVDIKFLFRVLHDLRLAQDVYLDLAGVFQLALDTLGQLQIGRASCRERV